MKGGDATEPVLPRPRHGLNPSRGNIPSHTLRRGTLEYLAAVHAGPSWETGRSIVQERVTKRY